MRSPNDNAIPCVLLRIRMYPLSFPSPSSLRSTDTFTNASSPNTLRAYKFAAKKLVPTMVVLLQKRGRRGDDVR